MTDLLTVDLFRIHHHPHPLARLHELQIDRLHERRITDGGRPSGMRLSIADPVRRVKAAFDPFWQIPFDDGVGARGHLLEDYLEVALFHADYAPLSGKQYTTQQPIRWHEHGVSAYDFVASDVEGADRVVSCKTSIKGGKPSAANIAQERRMMALDGYPAGSVFEVWIVNPSTFRATGPYTYELEQHHIDEARGELAGVTDAYRHFDSFEQPWAEPEWNDPDWWRGLNLESTSGAFRYATLDASGAIEARNRAYLKARAAAKEAKRAEDEAKALIREHVEEQIAAARRDGEHVKSVRAFSGDQEATYAIDARGAMRVTLRDFAEQHDAA